MEIDLEKIDQMILALMYLVIHNKAAHGARAWKGFDWDTLNRLHQKALIGDPVNRAKSVAVSSKGLELSKRLFEQHFTTGTE